MPRHLISAFFIILVFVLQATAYPLSVLQCKGQQIVDSTETPVFLRGVGLGGWLVPEGYMLHTPGFGSPTDIRQKIMDVVGAENTDLFYDEYRKHYVNRQDIDSIAAWGLNSIRLPFHYRLFYDEEQQQFIETGFTLTDSLIEWCRDNDMYVILDMHCAPGGQNDGNISDSDGEVARLWTEEANQDLTVAIWEEIARRYVDEPVIAGYDLLNEPVLPEGYTNKDLRRLYMRLTSAIRAIDPHHIIFVEGNIYATDFTDLTPPWATNLVYSFHKYWNEPTLSSIQYMLEIRKKYRIPLWMGEAGENSNPWFYQTVQLLEDNDIGWCWWTHKKLQTITSPLSAEMPAGYQKLIDYWNGQAAKPSQSFALSTLLAMTQNLKISNCIRRPGVLKALFDNEFGTTSQPVQQHILPCTLNAVDYDLGTNGVAYEDADYIKTRYDKDQPWNRGFRYRNDGVDIELSDDDQGAPYSVGWIEADEWLRYTVFNPEQAAYTTSIRYASPDARGTIRLSVDDEIILSKTLPSTGGWYQWQTVDVPDTFTMGSGSHTITLKVLNEGFNLNQLIVEKISTGGMGSDGNQPDTYQLGQNYPNPFNRQTTIPVQLHSFQPFQLNIYGVDGTLIKRLPAEGNDVNQEIKWQGRDLNGRPVGSGLYLYQMDMGDRQKTRKMVLIK
ncbi:MAG: cellulase family glycosylhydrolase [Caldithrix sp.]|nr:cellulase family glycosylhydrolase [Caldithrix sp.]